MAAPRTRSLAQARTRGTNPPHSFSSRAPGIPATRRAAQPARVQGDPVLATAHGGARAVALHPEQGWREWFVDAGFITQAPWWLWLGLALNVGAWVCSWRRVGPWPYTFFPLWFGFILVLDGLNFARRGSSILTRDWRRFALLFPISSVYWWIFEWMNNYVQNWFYIYDQAYSPLVINLLSTLYFSTVLPAVMEMFELLSSFPALKPLLPASEGTPRLSPRWTARLLVAGVALLWLPIRFPRYAYMLIWFCLIFLLDPINNLAGRPSAFGRLLARDWKFLLTLPLAGLACGFFWEMWNFYALPKWQYFLPFLNWTPHYFEMPIPGLLGYLPFAFELFAMYQFGLLIIGAKRDLLAY